ncbi:MAG: substrate-binding domain-containing protein [Verrucomicrobiota bacterium]
MSRTVAYIMPLPPGAHPGMDTVAHGIAAGMAGADAELRVLTSDLRDPHYSIEQNQSVVAATEAGVDGICIFILDEKEPEPAVWRAIGKNIPVVALHKPVFPATAVVTVPNFYHGIYLSQYLARRLEDGSKVAIVGGPPILDDDELVEGLLEGGKRCGFEFLNDPHDPAFRNQADVKGAGVDVAKHILDSFPDMDALIVFNDETLMDFLPVLEERGLLGTLPVVSRNGSPAAVEAVKRGDTLATYDYGLTELGLAAGKIFSDIFLEDADYEDAFFCPTFGRVIDEETAASYVPWSQRAPEIELVSGLE